MEFVPSRELSRSLYRDEIAPLMDREYPKLQHAVAFYGMCSEILGLDDEVSMDHMWGHESRSYSHKKTTCATQRS